MTVNYADIFAEYTEAPAATGVYACAESELRTSPIVLYFQKAR